MLPGADMGAPRVVFVKAHPATSPEPTPAQAESGNYKKRAMQWQGLTIRIENEAGSYRRGRSRDGKEWEVRMVFPYGEIARTEGVDGDPVDVIVGPYLDAPMVYVVHQRRYGDWENYDEDKCCIGFDSEESATAAFLANYNDPRFLGPVTAMPVAEFVAKVKATRKAPAMIKAVRVGPYIRQGKLVNLRGYDSRPSRAVKAPGQASLLSEEEVREVARRKVADMARHDHTKTADLFEGKPAAPVKQTETRAFKEWFGDSKVVDADGKPLVVYHGTKSDVGAFDPERAGGNTDSGGWGRGIYFAADPEYASVYAGRTDGSNIVPVYVAITNPFVADARERTAAIASLGLEAPRSGPTPEWSRQFSDAVRQRGHDGVLVILDGKPAEIVAFYPHQIKSAIGNNGDFSKDSPVITKSETPPSVLFVKSHISAYTKKDGTFVAAHEDSRITHPSEDRGWFGADVADAIRDHMESDPYADFGLRVVPRGFEVDVGDELPPSKRWEDGEDTGEELRGTSTIGVRKDDVERAIKTLERGGYSGSQVVLVAGDSVGAGEDEGERLIRNAKVVAVWKKAPKLAKSLPILFIKAKHRGDDRTIDMFGTHLEVRTRKDGKVQGYHVSNAKKDAALDAAISHLKEDAKQADMPAHERKEDKALVAKLEEARGGTGNDTAARRKAALAVLGDDWRSTPDGKKDAYKRSVKLADGGRYEVMIKPARTVAGNFYVGSYFHGGKRSGPGNAVDHPKTLEEAKAVADGWIAGVAAPKVAKVEPAKPDPETELRALWTKQGVSKERQDELIRQIGEKAKPGAKVGPFEVKRDGQADYRQSVRSTKEGPEDDNPRRKFYVTIAREGRGVALLAGPFDTHDEAKAMVDRARDKAIEVDPRASFDAFGTSGVESDNHKPGVLNDQLGLGVLQPAPSGDDHPAPIPRVMLNGLSDADRERWKGLHREQHELRYWHLPKLRKEMERHQGAINRALEEHNDHKRTAEDRLMALDPERQKAHRDAADKAFKRYQSALAKKEAAVARHQQMHDRMTRLGKEKDKILPKSGDLDFVWASQRYRDTHEREQHERDTFKTYSEHFKAKPQMAKSLPCSAPRVIVIRSSP